MRLPCVLHASAIAIFSWFGGAASAVTIDWVTVGDPGNACDPQLEGCFGAVAYSYQISKYEVTNAQYAEFLNAMAAADPLALYNTSMGSGFGGITRSGSSGSYTYSAIPSREDMPVNFVSFYDSLRFANWLQNGQGSGDTETGAYTLLGGTATPSNGTTVRRNLGAGATIVLTSEDEWYKAAYYSPLSTSYFDYPAGTDAQTTCATPRATANRANCRNAVGNLTNKGSYTGSASPYGTFDQGGNVWEWGEAIIRVLRGGDFSNGLLAASIRVFDAPSSEYSGYGFRVASIPEPEAPAAVPVGPEFQVNTYTTDHQERPSVAADAAGNFVVAWDLSRFGDIRARRYASNGTALGGEFQVNTYTTGGQGGASVGMEADGDFVVVWSSSGSPETDTSFSSIQARRYASDGSALESQFQVNTYTTQSQGGASLAMEGDGDFVVVWTSYGSFGTDTSRESVQAQRYASDGTALGSEFQVNTYTTNRQLRPSVAVEGDGDFVVVWERYLSSLNSSIQGQRYASDGAALGSEFQVNTIGEQPSVAADADGDFLVVWDGVRGQRYSSDGTALGSEFQVNTYATDTQGGPSVAMEADGDFVVVWTGPPGGIQARRYASDGTALGSEFQVNTYTTDRQEGPSVAVAGDTHFVVVWTSYGSSGTDTSQESIQGQRYGADEDGDGVANGGDDCIDVANPSQLDVDGDGCGNACDADFNQDGVTGASDFNTLRFCLGKHVPGMGPAADPICAESDMNGNGIVGASDFNTLRMEFGTAPGRGSPSCL